MSGVCDSGEHSQAHLLMGSGAHRRWQGFGHGGIFEGCLCCLGFHAILAQLPQAPTGKGSFLKAMQAGNREV